jgi:hypothetical protein
MFDKKSSIFKKPKNFEKVAAQITITTQKA